MKRSSASIAVLMGFLFVIGVGPARAQYPKGNYACSFDATGYTAPNTNQSVNVGGIFSLTVGPDGRSLSQSTATLSVNDGGAGSAVCNYGNGSGNIGQEPSGIHDAPLNYQAAISNSAVCPPGNAILTLIPVQSGLSFIYVNESGFFGNGSCGLADPPLSGSAFICRYMINDATGMGSGFGALVTIPPLDQPAIARVAFGTIFDEYPKGPGVCLYSAAGTATYPLPGQPNQGTWKTNAKLVLGICPADPPPPFTSVSFITTKDTVIITAPGISSSTCSRAKKGFLDLSTKEIKFGAQKLNSTTTRPIIVTNTGTESAKIDEISIGGAGAFGQTNNCVDALAPKQSCTITASFKPTMKPQVGATIMIFSDASTAILSVSLLGAGK
jgi:hypothetical protein